LSKEEKYALIAGIILGAILVTVITMVPWSYHSQAVRAKEQCEKTLPRNQECVITAVPKE
jgi:hypothetical protein